MVVLCLFKVIATVFSYSSGGAGGIFAPALFIGGMLGGVVGLVDAKVLGHGGNEVGAFALVGMGAVFAGVIRAPITSVLIIFEMTGSYGLILPLMISNMTAYAIAKRFRPVPIYEALLEQDEIFLPHKKGGTKHVLDNLTVSEAYLRNPVVLRSGMTVSRAFEFVQDHEFTTFPILDDRERCVGMITEMRLRRTAANGGGEHSIADVADRVHSVHPDQHLNKAVLRMNHAQVRQLAITTRGDEQRFMGIITMSDIVRVQAEALDERELTTAPETEAVA
jgi:CIC family chloride channel protein